MRTTSLLLSTVLLPAAWVGLAASREGLTGAAGAAPPATGPKRAGPTKLTVDFITDRDKAPGKPVLLVLPEEGAAFTDFCKALAPKDGTAVYVRFGGQDTASAMAGAVAMSLRKGRAEARFFDPNRVVVIAGPKGIGAALELLDRFGDRIDGAILISAAPVQRTDEAIQVWKPSKEAWKVPIWVTVGSSVKDAAQTLLMWRQVAAGAPKDACLTIDVRLDEAAGYVNPDPQIGKWFDAVAAGKTPAVGPDRQAEAERKTYGKPADELLDAFKNMPAAEPGAAVTKREPPVEVRAVAPKDWTRQERAERPYKTEDSPYVQLYLSSGRDSPLFARVCGAKWTGKAADLLADYDRRLAERGFLVVRYHQGDLGPKAYAISSILWPTKDKWHRWLVVSVAGDGSADSPAAPLVMVLDATKKPDTRAMAVAARLLAETAAVRWVGGEPARDAAGDTK
jgi:hypothetical protein